MAWRDRLRRASFRGVEFFVDEDNYESGRRLSLHEFSNRDVPYSEDLGRKQRTYSFKAFLIGPDFDIQRDQLIRALETEGSGTLIHPWYGSVDVTPYGFKTTHTKTTLGMAAFDLKFFESGQLDIVLVGLDSNQRLVEVSQNSILTASNSLRDRVQSITDIASQTVMDVRGIFNVFSNTVESILDIGGVVADSFSSLNLQVAGLIDDVDSLLRSPQNLANRFNQSFDIMQAVFDDAVGRYEAFLRFAGFSEYSNTSFRTQANINTRTIEKAINDYIRVTSQSYASQNIIEIPKTTTEEFIRERERLTVHMDQLLSESVDIFGEPAVLDEESYESLSLVKASLITAYPSFNETFLQERVTRLSESQPSIVAYYDLQGNLEGEEDFTIRNGIQNPLFLPANTDLFYI